ncbi:hypothetical protein AVEN_131565-1 [Araneus ventricosus]|uniref:Uncharacterized protein n=1 Tax=Araneus ventricosus TaxID=182803 RepID=A0A4Y2SPL2_ARAVE|nr:hypothetical protein AVEN_131565-1 [Araneus ventricosus]
MAIFLLHKLSLLFFDGKRKHPLTKDPDKQHFSDMNKLRHLLKNIDSVVTRIKNAGKLGKEKISMPVRHTGKPDKGLSITARRYTCNRPSSGGSTGSKGQNRQRIFGFRTSDP